MRLMKRVRFFGVFKVLSFFSLGGVLEPESGLCLSSAVDGEREAVVATDQRDCECSANFGARRRWSASSAAKFATGKEREGGNTFVWGTDTVRELRLGEMG